MTMEAIVGTPMEIDHTVPEALGGLTEEDNLWLACALCNQHKGNRIAAPDPLTGDNVPLFDPRRQRWHEHFAWTTEADSPDADQPLQSAPHLARPRPPRARPRGARRLRPAARP